MLGGSPELRCALFLELPPWAVPLPSNRRDMGVVGDPIIFLPVSHNLRAFKTMAVKCERVDVILEACVPLVSSCASAVTLLGKSQRPLSVRSEACVPLMLRECCDITRKEPASSFRML
ncbi:hypothetical protein Sjap_002355 [Stephania japonica]|uniref:Uncharacterized protein n=1 Tax=Stephania japonica TaxID=461633 RepID=A0AAP0KPC3_9MAGN